MTAIAISDFLPDFGKQAWRSEDTLTPFLPHEVPERVGEILQPEIDVETTIHGEVAKAEAEVTERLTAQHEEELRAEREGHAAEIERLQAEFGAEGGARIASSLADMEAKLTELTTSIAARILSSLVTEDMLRRSIEDLAATIRGAIRESGAVRVTVHGPHSLFERLSEQVEEHASIVHHIETPGFDLVVDIDGSLFETRLADWSTSLAGALT